jgi:hypothetical protein
MVQGEGVMKSNSISERYAENKWCPFTQISAAPSGDVYRNGDQRGTCAGSNCMAWRWTHPADPTSDDGYCGMVQR